MTDHDTRFGPQDGQHRDHTGTGTGQDPSHGSDHPALGQSHDHGGHGGHKWMMMACCVPMLVIAIVLVASGTAGAGIIIVAIGCTLVMGMMMGGHGGGEGDRT